MGIKFGSIIMTILFLFIAKISFEASTDAKPAAARSTVGATVGRAPASINSIDEDYRAHMNATAVNH
jgi:hypothetical protein